MTSKRLLICSPSNAIRGGVEIIVNDLCRELPKHGWETFLGLAKGSRFNDVDAYQREYPGLPIVEIDGTRGTRQGRVEALTRLIRRIEPDVVLSARIFDAYEAMSALKRRGGSARLAVTIQVYEPQYIHDLRDHRHSVDLCVTSGEMIREAVIQWSGLPGGRVVSIPGGVSPTQVASAPRYPGTAIRLGYVGRLDQDQKRILDIETFLRELDKRDIDYTFDIVGTGPYERQLVQTLTTWVASGRVKFHGWQSKERLYSEFFPKMDCLVHFAHTEGVTIAPREAMVHGVVPVISEFIGLKTEGQFIPEWNSLTFPVGDVATAAASISRLMFEPRLLERLSVNAANSQTGKYTFAGSIKAWAEALDRCVDQRVATGIEAKRRDPADGRLTRIGLSPRTAQRLRNFFGRRHLHNDPGGEWPTGSGLMASVAAEEILRFAREYEERREHTTASVFLEARDRHNRL